MYNEKNVIVQLYVRLAQNGERTIEQVPNRDNLRQVVENILNQWAQE